MSDPSLENAQKDTTKAELKSGKREEEEREKWVGPFGSQPMAILNGFSKLKICPPNFLKIKF